MLVERAHQHTSFVEGYAARGDAEVPETLASDSKGERIFEGLEAGEEAIGLDHDPRAGRDRAGLLEIADELLHIDGAAFVQAPDTDVRIDHHHRLDVHRQALEQAADGTRLAAVDAVIETTPTRQA